MGRRAERRAERGGSDHHPHLHHTQAMADPTRVVARRGGAWFIDTVICGLAAAIPALLLGDALLDETRVGDQRLAWIDDVLAVKVRDTYIWFRQSELLIIGGFFLLAVLLVMVVLPGRRGWSPGMLAAEVRLVNHDGERAGVFRALVRTVFWIIDGFPGLPLVGYAVASASRRHQRVGDHVARTYVVDKRGAGHPVDEPIEASTPLAADATWVPDDEPPEAAEPSESPAPDQSAPPTAVAPPEGVPLDEPIWDRRHRRYVMWHSRSGRWLEHADEGWRPLVDDDT